MHRRDLIAVGTLALLGASATSASASGSSESSKPAGPSFVNLSGVALPVIVDGRVRNYVFVTMKLYLGGSATSESMRLKDAYFRDGLVRVAHRSGFAVPGDWTKLDETKINAAVMAMAPIISGAGSVVKSEVAIQMPRRRTGMLQDQPQSTAPTAH